MTFVSFVMPVRNEEAYIGASLQSLVDQTYPAADYEIIDQIRSNHPHVLRLDNPAGIVPVAMNIGIRAARGDVIIRADGHNIYSRNYAENCVKYLALTGADNVGGPWVTAAADDSLGARLVAAILSNPFGVGDAKFRTSKREGFVDTVPFGAFRKEVFARVGLYNEKLVRNQDNELNSRIRAAGGKIYLSPALTTRYHPVKSFAGLLKYAFRTCQWHIFTLRENKRSMGLRHLAPAAFLLGLLLLASLSPISNAARATLLLVLAGYLLIGFYFSVKSVRHGQRLVALVQPFATLLFHCAYGAGTLFGLVYLFKQPSLRPIRSGLPIQQ